MERVDWMWEVLRVMEEDARHKGWDNLIEQIHVTRHVLLSEISAKREASLPANVIRVNFTALTRAH